MKNTSADPDAHNARFIFETRSWKTLAACLAIAVMTVMLQGCKGGTIQGITGQAAPSGTGGPARFFLQGQGICDKVSFNFGDGSPVLEVANYDFANLPLVQHSYTGWGGGHTVKAGSVQNCVGQAEMIFTSGQSVFTVGFGQPQTTTCANISGLLSKPNLRTNTKVHMTTNPNPNVKINFGCAFNGCIYDANGSNTVASAPFPFPGMKEFSMVMRVGTQIVQGGTNVTFTTNQAGPLEVCVNDNDLFNNTGAWGLIIDVDESKAP